jgi:Zn-dependent peptidase ImmA (M78 family)
MRWARERSGLKADALVGRFPKYAAWERGEALPTLRQLEDLAKKTLTPLGYFFLPEPPEDKLPIPDFRTVKDEPLRRPSPNLLETVQMMQRRQGWMREFLIEQGEKPLPFMGSATLAAEPTRVAAKILEVLRRERAWASLYPTWTDALGALRTAIEQAGILVAINGVVGNNVHRKLDTDEFRGFVLVDEYAPLIFVNGADAKAAQMFTLAHELAHLWLGRGGVFNLEALQPADDDVEKFCNRVAAEFLIPARELNACWSEAAQTEEPFQALARQFKISPLVAARRALDLGLIAKAYFFEFYEAYQEDERRKASQRPSGGDFYATQDVRLGRRFANAVVRAAKEGRLLYRDAYHLTGLSGETFDRYAKALGFQIGA